MPERKLIAYHRLTRLMLVCGLCALWSLFALAPLPILADEVIMTTGEKFSSAKVWEENGKIRFNMHGLVVSVEKSEVAQIVRTQARPDPTMKRSMPEKTAPMLPAIKEEHAPIIKPLEAPTQEVSQSTPQKSKHTPKPDNTNQRRKLTGTGLTGVEWHLQPADLPGLVKLDTEPIYGGVDQYHLPDDRMRLGPAGLDGKVYGFWRNRLYTITMWAEGPPAYKRLRKAVFDRFGQGQKNGSGLERYVWTDPTTDRMLEFDPRLNIGLFWMRSRVLDQKIKLLYPE